MNKPNMIAAPLVAACATLLSIEAAEAAPTENIPASSCKARFGSVVVRSDGEIENASTSWAYVICPVRRPVGSPSTATTLAGTVFMVDRHSSSNGWCRVRSKNPGGTNRYGSLAYSAGSSTSYQQLSLPSLTDTYSWSHFFIECALPPADGGARSRLQMVRSIQ